MNPVEFFFQIIEPTKISQDMFDSAMVRRVTDSWCNRKVRKGNCKQRNPRKLSTTCLFSKTFRSDVNSPIIPKIVNVNIFTKVKFEPLMLRLLRCCIYLLIPITCLFVCLFVCAFVFSKRNI